MFYIMLYSLYTRVADSDYKALCSKTQNCSVTVGAFSQRIHIYALSAVVSVPIQSYFPTLSIESEISQSHNLKVVGRNVKV